MHARLAQLRTLREVARRGSFSRAAEALRLSQPAISMQIRQLETELGVTLLERVGKRAFPTHAGEVLLHHVERALAELTAAESAVAALRGTRTGRVRIGTGATTTIHLLPPLLRRLRLRHPGIELTVVTGNAADMAQAVVNNAIDLAIVTLPVSGRELRVTPFYRDRLVAIAPAEPPWSKRRTVKPADLASHPLILYERGARIRNVIDSWFTKNGAAPHVTMEVGSDEATKRLVGVGLGLSVISAIAVREEVRAGELIALELVPRLARNLGLVRRRDRRPSPALAATIEALEDFAAKNAESAG